MALEMVTASCGFGDGITTVPDMDTDDKRISGMKMGGRRMKTGLTTKRETEES